MTDGKWRRGVGKFKFMINELKLQTPESEKKSYDEKNAQSKNTEMKVWLFVAQTFAVKSRFYFFFSWSSFGFLKRLTT